MKLFPPEPFTEPVVTPSEPTNPEVKPTESAENPTDSNIANPDNPSDNSASVTAKKANTIKVTVKTKTIKAKKINKNVKIRIK